MLDDIICKYEMAMNCVLSQHLSTPSISAFKSMFACVDNMCVCAYERVCVNVMYKKLEKKEADWLYDCMMNKLRFKRQHIHEMFAFQLVVRDLGIELSTEVKNAGRLYMIHE